MCFALLRIASLCSPVIAVPAAGRHHVSHYSVFMPVSWSSHFRAVGHLSCSSRIAMRLIQARAETASPLLHRLLKSYATARLLSMGSDLDSWSRFIISPSSSSSSEWTGGRVSKCLSVLTCFVAIRIFLDTSIHSTIFDSRRTSPRALSLPHRSPFHHRCDGVPLRDTVLPATSYLAQRLGEHHPLFYVWESSACFYW